MSAFGVRGYRWSGRTKKYYQKSISRLLYWRPSFTLLDGSTLLLRINCHRSPLVLVQTSYDLWTYVTSSLKKTDERRKGHLRVVGPLGDHITKNLYLVYCIKDERKGLDSPLLRSGTDEHDRQRRIPVEISTESYRGTHSLVNRLFTLLSPSSEHLVGYLDHWVGASHLPGVWYRCFQQRFVWSCFCCWWISCVIPYSTEKQH